LDERRGHQREPKENTGGDPINDQLLDSRYSSGPWRLFNNGRKDKQKGARNGAKGRTRDKSGGPKRCCGAPGKSGLRGGEEKKGDRCCGRGKRVSVGPKWRRCERSFPVNREEGSGDQSKITKKPRGVGLFEDTASFRGVFLGSKAVGMFFAEPWEQGVTQGWRSMRGNRQWTKKFGGNPGCRIATAQKCWKKWSTTAKGEKADTVETITQLRKGEFLPRNIPTRGSDKIPGKKKRRNNGKASKCRMDTTRKGGRRLAKTSGRSAPERRSSAERRGGEEKNETPFWKTGTRKSPKKNASSKTQTAKKTERPPGSIIAGAMNS